MANRKKARFLYLITLAAAVMLIAGCGKGGLSLISGNSAETSAKTMRWDKMPEMQIDLDKSYLAKFHTTKGEFTVKLFTDEAPVTVNNFVFLAREGFYEATSTGPCSAARSVSSRSWRWVRTSSTRASPGGT
jgi:hypothetical protein